MPEQDAGHVSDEHLEEQLQYYSDRAPEYDDWWHRKGSFDQGDESNSGWFRDVEVASSVLDGTDLGRSCIELAPGTGTWSVKLAPRVAELTLVDGSRAMLEQNPVTREPHVHVEVADLFTWEPVGTFDSVVFTFWISHVPEERLDRFFQLVSTLLDDHGSVFFVDDLPKAVSAPHVEAAQGQTMVRRLNDGRTATIVKNFYSDERLLAAADLAGIDLEITRTDEYFLIGRGVKR